MVGPKSHIASILALNDTQLAHHRKTIGEFVFGWVAVPVAMSMVSLGPAMLLEGFWGVGWLSRVAYWIGGVWFVGGCICLWIEDWKMIGESSVHFDPRSPSLVIRQNFLHARSPSCEIIPVRDLLLFRYWQPETDNECAGFVLRLQVSKNIHDPTSGYFLHFEYAATDVSQAERETTRLAAALVAATGVEYFDIQRSGQARFAPWVCGELPAV